MLVYRSKLDLDGDRTGRDGPGGGWMRTLSKVSMGKGWKGSGQDKLPSEEGLEARLEREMWEEPVAGSCGLCRRLDASSDQAWEMVMSS